VHADLEAPVEDLLELVPTLVCPSRVFPRPISFANLRFPSMMIATWWGIVPCFTE